MSWNLSISTWSIEPFSTQQDGKTVRGRIANISPTSVRLETGKTFRGLPEPSIKEIKEKRPEKKWNGVWAGAGVGASVGVVTAIGVCSSSGGCTNGAPASMLLTFTGLGMGTGALIDFFVQKWDPVFNAGGRAASRELHLRPIIQDNLKGVQLALEF